MSPVSSHVPLSAVLIARNEARNIDECLRALDWADEIIVADTGSMDETRELAARYRNVRVVSISFEGFATAKQRALDFASHDWAFSIDCDERVSPELRDEIRIALSTDPRGVAFSLARRNHFLGQAISGCGWWPDRVLRLFRRSEARFGNELVHEEVRLPQGVALRELTYPLQHYSYTDLPQFFRKQLDYGLMGAEELARTGRSPSRMAAVLRPGAAFFRVYLLRAGWRDGFAGFLIAAGIAFSTLVKYAVHASERAPR